MVDYTDFANYASDPWENITTNEREWYDPALRDVYIRNAVYSPHVTMKIDLNGPKARTINFNDIIPPRANIAALSNRAMESSRLHTDTYGRDVTTERMGNGMAFHRESQMFNFWERNGKAAGIINIINGGLGQVIVDHLDALARNSFFNHPNPTMGTASASGFGLIGADEKMTTDLIDYIWLRLRDRQRPYSALPAHYPTGEEMLCITTAGVVHDLKREIGVGSGELTFVDVHKYSHGGKLIRGEIGMWRGVRFIDNGFAKLWNCGLNEVQTTIKAEVKPGDGAPDPATTKVEGTRKVGQPAATHYLTVQDSAGFSVGDMVSIHRTRHSSGTLTTYSSRGVLNGPIYDDPQKQDVEIYSIDTSGGAGDHHIAFNEPFMMVDQSGEGLETDLGSGVYGYVTLAATIHSALFLVPGISNNGLVAGIAQPPRIYTPRPIDDYESIYRISYDMWLKYALWDSRAYELVFLRGANALTGKSAVFY